MHEFQSAWELFLLQQQLHSLQVRHVIKRNRKLTEPQALSLQNLRLLSALILEAIS